MREVRILDAGLKLLALPYHEQMLASDLIECSYTEELDGPDTCSITWATDEAMAKIALSSPALYARIADQDGDRRTYLIRNPSFSHGVEGIQVVLRGDRIWTQLLSRYVYPNESVFSSISAADLARHVIQASGAGDAFRVTADEAVIDFYEIGIYTSPLRILRDIADSTGLNLLFTETPRPTLRFSSRPTKAQRTIRYGASLEQIARQVDLSERVTRMYGAGGGDPPLTLSKAARSGGQAYIDAPSHSPENHFVGVYRNESLRDWANLILPQKNPDFSGDYTADGVSVGWEKIGAPICSEELGTQFFTHGTAAQKIITSGTDISGIQCQYDGVPGTNCVRWSSIYVESMGANTNLYVEVVAGAKRAYNIIRGSDNPAGRVITITRLGMTLPQQSQTYRIYTTGGPSTFYVDAVLVAQGEEFIQFINGDMSDVLYREAEARLRKMEHAGVRYNISAPMQRLTVGDVVDVDDTVLGAHSLQVTKKRADVLAPSYQYEVGVLPDRTAPKIVSRILDRQRQVSQARKRQDRAAKAVAAQDALKGGRVEFFTGNYIEKAPTDRAHLTAGHVYTDGDNVYSMPAYNGSRVGHEKTFYLYVNEFTATIEQAEDLALPAQHAPLYKVETPPATQTSDYPTYTPLFQPAPAELTLDLPVLGVTPTASQTLRCVWPDVVNADAYELEYRKVTTIESRWSKATDTTSPSDLTGLDNGSEYEVRLRATATKFTDSEWSVGRATPAAPRVVLTVTDDAPQVGDTAILRWNRYYGAIGYRLEVKFRSTDFSDPTFTENSDADTLQSHQNFSAALAFAFRVIALLPGNQESAPSNIIVIRWR